MSLKRKFFASGLAILTIVSMAVFFNVYEPWLPVGPDLVQDGGFENPSCTNEWTGWSKNTRWDRHSGFRKSAGVTLTTSTNGHGVLRMTIRDLDVPAFRVSARATARDIVHGKEGYHVPRGIFFYRSTSGKSLFSIHHGIFDIRQTTGWKRYSAIFPVPEDVQDARLQFQNYGSEGTLQIDDISAVPVRPRPSAAGFSVFFLILWSTVFAYCLIVLKPWAKRGGWLILMVALAIVIGTATPGKILDNGIKDTVSFTKKQIEKPQPTIQKPVTPEKPAIGSRAPAKTTTIKKDDEIVNEVHFQGHLILFFLLAGLCAQAWLGRIKAVAFGMFLFACSTEVLQYVSIDREAGTDDLLIDLAGITAGLLLASSILLVMKRLRSIRH